MFPTVSNEVTLSRRQWFIVGIGLELLAVGLIAALFTTPLERHFFSGAGWFILVTALQVGSGAASLGAWSRQRDAIGLIGLALAILTAVLITAFALVFLMIKALSGLR